MNIIMRRINGCWSVAAHGVSDEGLGRALRYWRLLGYEVTVARIPESEQ